MTRGGATYFYHQDGLGTVTDLTDAAGNTAQSYAYDTWGNVIEQTGSVEQPYTFTGREFDPETRLIYLRARYYDPKTGRFLNEDPARFAGGFNLYAYVLNNPTNLVDPWGLWWISRHRELTQKAMTSRCFSSDEMNIAIAANLHIDRLANQTNNPDHYMPGTESEAAGRVKAWLDLAVARELSGDHTGAMRALGTGLHPVQDRLAHSAQNAGWAEHLNLFHSPDDPEAHPEEFRQALEDSISYIGQFLAHIGKQGYVCGR